MSLKILLQVLISTTSKKDIYDVVKIDFSYLAIQNIVATVWDTFTSIARAGYGSTLTPEPLDRSRLIATANLMSHFVEDVPKQVFGIIYDLVINDKVKVKLPKLFAGFGVSFAVLGGLLLSLLLLGFKRKSCTDN